MVKIGFLTLRCKTNAAPRVKSMINPGVVFIDRITLWSLTNLNNHEF